MISSWSKRRKKTSKSPGRILVTGASGFVGRYLLALFQGGEDTVLGTYAHRKPFAPCPGTFWLRQDLTDELSVRRLIREFRPTNVYHLAAQSIPRLSWDRREETLAVNVLGTVHLLRALRLQPSCRFLFVSTNQVYGQSFRSGTPLDESARVWPQNPYAASKALAELAVRNFGQRFGLDCVIARPFNHLGAGQTARLVLSDWCRQVARAERGLAAPELCVGNLDAFRDFLHVKDVVRAYRLMMEQGVSGGVYNICTEKSVLLQRYADALLKEARVPMRLRVETSRFRKDDPPRMDGTAAPLMALGWKPEHTAFEALSEMLAWWREQVLKEQK